MPEYSAELTIVKTVKLRADGPEEAREAAWLLIHKLPIGEEITDVDITFVGP